MSRVCLIDAHSLCYRAFFAIRANLTTSYGQPTNAVYGFVSMLNRILSEVNPEYAVMCFDVAKPTFREEKFKEYKIHRAPMPDDLKTQIPLIREVISAYNISIIEREGFEADDVIATLTRKADKQGHEVVIVTSDKDMLQLVTEDIKVYNPYKGEGVYFGPGEVKEQFGVKPQNIVDLLSLMGDSVDNIPGVKGIGEKTAKDLLEDFNDVDSMIKNTDKIKSDKIRDLIRENKDMIRLSRELAVLMQDIDIDFDLKGFALKDPDYDKLYNIFSKLEFKSLLKSLGEKMPRKSLGQEVGFLKEINEITDFKPLEKELNKTKSFAFSIYNEQNKLKAYIYTGKDSLYILTNKDQIKQVLEDRSFQKAGSDIKSAKLVLDRHGINIKENYFDIMIAAYLLDPARSGYQLETLIFDYLKIGPLNKEDFEKKEAVFIYKLKEVLEKELGEKNLDELFYKLEMPLVDVLFKIEKNGIKIDCELLKDLAGRLERELNKLTREIFDISHREFNINSPKQLGQVLFEELKLPVVKKTKTGFSTDEEVLRKLALQHKVPSLILKYRQITKLKSTYVDVLPELCDKKTHRIHSNFLQTGTETGRLSSNNPNLQNIPIKSELGREIRSAFIAGSSKWSLFSCDYSQIELRILAHLSKDDALITAFRNNADIHKTTAALIYNLSIEDVQEEMREVAKRVNFGVIYGISAYGLAKDLDVSPDVAQEFIDTYFLRYPKVKQFINEQIELANKKGYVSTIMGRRRYLPYINSKNNSLRQFSERQAVNASIQGSAADLIKLAMINIQKELDDKEMQSKMVLQVHDELVFDFPNDEKDNLIKIVKVGMEEAIKIDVPIKASLKIGKNWATMEEYELEK